MRILRIQLVAARLSRHARITGLLVAVLALMLAPAASHAADPPASPWHGVLTQDLLAVVHGGSSRGIGAPSLAHLNLTLDGSRWGGSSDTLLYLDVLGTGGSSISARAGDLQRLDNAEAPDTLRLYEAWWQQDLGEPHRWIRVGLQDYNALFDTLDAASLFLNSSLGIEPTISQSGVSIFPQTTLGAVAHWQDRHGVYLMAALFNGVPGRPGDNYGTHVTFGKRDGVFSTLEAGIETHGARPTKLAVGAWIDTSRHTRLPYPQRNHDWYAIGQTRLLGGGAGGAALDGFVQWGSAMTRDERIDRYFGAGLRLDGTWMHGRAASLGLAMARAFVRGRPGGPPGGAETAWELTASTAMGPHLSLQPDIQYIHNPGATGSVPDALVAGMRFQLHW